MTLRLLPLLRKGGPRNWQIFICAFIPEVSTGVYRQITGIIIFGHFLKNIIFGPSRVPRRVSLSRFCFEKLRWSRLSISPENPRLQSKTQRAVDAISLCLACPEGSVDFCLIMDGILDDLSHVSGVTEALENRKE
jgi:hypothetical protein